MINMFMNTKDIVTMGDFNHYMENKIENRVERISKQSKKTKWKKNKNKKRK